DPLVRPAEVELIPENYFASLELAKIFPQSGRLEVDLGCGDGSFVIEMAARHPERNFVGIEKLEGRVETACRKGARRGLRNLRVMRIETSYAIQYLLPPGSTAVVHLLFPDPWPKRKHKRRRIVTPDFLALVHKLLAADGCLHLATDQQSYFERIRDAVASSPFIEDPEMGEEYPPTTFEKRFVAQGLPIYRLLLRKIS
ncbi:MAG TPA: tRNA (guanosine(46)-N7)-methyltransferase TrmB, partial [Chthoniobacterales bacterium]